MKSRRTLWFIGAGLTSAFAASLCCIGPVVMLAVGLGGFAAASWFAAYRPLLLALTFGLLGASWVLILRSRSSCAAGESCSTKAPPKRTTVTLLSIATLLTVGLAAYPWFAERVAITASDSQSMMHSRKGAESDSIRFSIPSMDCAACATMIASTLRREDGVLAAEVTYADKEAVILFDPAVTDLPRLRSAIRATGFPPDNAPENHP